MKTKITNSSKLAKAIIAILLLFLFPNDYKHYIPNGDIILNATSIALLIIGYILYFPSIISYIKNNLLYSIPFVIILFSTILHEGNIALAIQDVIILLIIDFIGATYNHESKKIIHIGEYISLAILIINLIVTIINRGPALYTATAGRVYFIFEGSIAKLIICNMLLLFMRNDKCKLFGAYQIVHYIIYIITLLLIPFSITYIIGTIIMMASVIATSVKRNYKSQYKLISKSIIITIILNIIILATGTFLPEISSAFGKSTTLSGRTVIWESAIEIIKENPVIGIGEYDSKLFLQKTQIEGATHSHNQLLQILLNTGVIGATVYLIQLIKLLKIREVKNKVFTKNLVLYMGFLLTMLIMGIASRPFDGFFYLATIIAINHMRPNMMHKNNRNTKVCI